jgi:L-asparagine transporter-like permease
MDLFTLLKIAAILAILLLVAAIIVTARGQKGDSD